MAQRRNLRLCTRSASGKASQPEGGWERKREIKASRWAELWSRCKELTGKNSWQSYSWRSTSTREMQERHWKPLKRKSKTWQRTSAQQTRNPPQRHVHPQQSGAQKCHTCDQHPSPAVEDSMLVVLQRRRFLLCGGHHTGDLHEMHWSWGCAVAKRCDGHPLIWKGVMWSHQRLEGTKWVSRIPAVTKADPKLMDLDILTPTTSEKAYLRFVGGGWSSKNTARVLSWKSKL